MLPLLPLLLLPLTADRLADAEAALHERLAELAARYEEEKGQWDAEREHLINEHAQALQRLHQLGDRTLSLCTTEHEPEERRLSADLDIGGHAALDPFMGLEFGDPPARQSEASLSRAPTDPFGEPIVTPPAEMEPVLQAPPPDPFGFLGFEGVPPSPSPAPSPTRALVPETSPSVADAKLFVGSGDPFSGLGVDGSHPAKRPEKSEEANTRAEDPQEPGLKWERERKQLENKLATAMRLSRGLEVQVADLKRQVCRRDRAACAPANVLLSTAGKTY